jgi:pectate lyase
MRLRLRFGSVNPLSAQAPVLCAACRRQRQASFQQLHVSGHARLRLLHLHPGKETRMTHTTRLHARQPLAFCIALLLGLPSAALATNPAPTPAPTPPPPTTSACLGSPIGFAAQGGGTTGGAGGTVVTVRTGAQLATAIANHEAAWKSNNRQRTVIRIDGTINASNSPVNRFDIKDTANLSLIGVGNRGLLDGRGIMVRGASNIIIRNLTIRYVRDGSGDGIELDGTRPIRNVWIDHNTFYNRLNVDKDFYDGLVDGKGDVSLVTLSYNQFRDSWKTSLWGHSDSSNNDRRVTFAFNHFDNVNSRTPLLRFGQTHIYNNYFNRILDSGVNTRMGNRVRLDNNVFENSRNPIMSCYSSQPGNWDARGNQFNNVTWQSGDGCRLAGPNVGSTVSYTPPYSYSLMPANQVKAHVTQNAGAGRCAL